MSSPSLDRRNRSHVPADQLNRGRANVQAIRDRQEEHQNNAIWRQQQMSNRDKSPMGFARTDTSRTQAALAAYAELNEALDQAVDEIEVAFKRSRQEAAASGPDSSDMSRAPVLGRRGAVS